MADTFHRRLAHRLIAGGLVIATLLGAGVAWLDVPPDAPGVDGRDVQYRVTVPDGVSACVIPRR